MTLKTGSRGAEVRWLQTLLNVKADGVFGPVTKEAVLRFQAEQSLKQDGIVGKYTRAALESAFGEKYEAPAFTKPVDYKQYDARWASKMYSSHGDASQTIRSSGCGPTALADVVATLIDANVTPPELSEKALAWGDRTRANGTAWSFFAHAAKEYPFGGYEKTSSLRGLEKALTPAGSSSRAWERATGRRAATSSASGNTTAHIFMPAIPRPKAVRSRRRKALWPKERCFSAFTPKRTEKGGVLS